MRALVAETVASTIPSMGSLSFPKNVPVEQPPVVSSKGWGKTILPESDAHWRAIDVAAASWVVIAVSVKVNTAQRFARLRTAPLLGSFDW
jgi:hypothetical protein